MLTVI
jgi:hypothetical protein